MPLNKNCPGESWANQSPVCGKLGQCVFGGTENQDPSVFSVPVLGLMSCMMLHPLGQSPFLSLPCSLAVLKKWWDVVDNTVYSILVWICFITFQSSASPLMKFFLLLKMQMEWAQISDGASPRSQGTKDRPGV
ncbi:hypothetical protein DR999_PMT17158 [Platysternon megacephalum]|uniref:Uncharacterized protein n=1 Tax=Platysternon megacephalum TaxID=55544 RepID=A0A4D9DU20_9SAUR|nr:hypothetical protein DR999_PMT17158 [Platysternon megacephalum]